MPQLVKHMSHVAQHLGAAKEKERCSWLKRKLFHWQMCHAGLCATSVACIEYRKAFDHDQILRVLQFLGVEDPIETCIKELMPLWKIRFTIISGENHVRIANVIQKKATHWLLCTFTCQYYRLLNHLGSATSNMRIELSRSSRTMCEWSSGCYPDLLLFICAF